VDNFDQPTKQRQTLQFIEKGPTVGEGQTWVGNPQIQAEKPLESKMKLMQEIAQKNTSLLVEPLTETQVEAIKAIISMSLYRVRCIPKSKDSKIENYIQLDIKQAKSTELYSIRYNPNIAPKK